jgi:hypothetical protein
MNVLDSGIATEASVKGDSASVTYTVDTPMADFFIKEAKIDFKKKPDDDKVKIDGRLKLDQNGSVPTLQVVTVAMCLKHSF